MTPHAASPLPYVGSRALVFRISRTWRPPAGTWIREVWDAAANVFDEIFARRRGEYCKQRSARLWAEQYRRDQDEARVRRIVEQQRLALLKKQRDADYRAWLNYRQALADVTLIAAIRTAYKKRPKRREARDNLARIMVARAVEWANYATPLIA